MRKKQFLILTLFMVSLFVKAQKPVTVTATVFPPYSTKLSYYINNPNKVQVTFLNTGMQPLDVYVQGRLAGDNGVEIKTDPNYKPPTPITLNPGIPFHLTQDNIGDIFSADHIVYHGTSELELIKAGGLPEGNYQLCFNVYDFNTGALLSNEDMGCSNVIIVAYIDPPVILNPVCGDSITALNPQNVLISWTTPVGAGPNIRYRFVMTEMHPGNRNPNDAMAAASPPYFLEKDLNTPQLLIGPGDPPLIKGNSYAFYVQAYDPNNEVIFNNKGISKVCWFHYKAGNHIVNDTISPFGGGGILFPVKFPDMLAGRALTINGKIHYRYVEDNTTGPLAHERFDLVDMFVLKKPDGEYINLYDLGMQDQNPMAGQITYDFEDENGNALPAEDIKTNQGYVNKETGVNIAKDGSIKVASGITDANGNFNTLFIVPPGTYYGLLHKNVTAKLIATSTHTDASAGGQIHTASTTATTTLGTGDLYRVLRVVLEDKDIYGHPSEPIIPDSGVSTVTKNDLEALVRTYKINVLVKGQYTRRSDGTFAGDIPLPGMYGKLVRDNTILPLSFPKGEGTVAAPKGPPQPKQVIGEAVTNGNGVLQFKKVVQFERKEAGNTSGQVTQRMAYYIKPTKTGEKNYSSYGPSYSVDLPDAPDNVFSTVNDKNWKIPQVWESVLVQALNPKILGIVQDAKNKIPVKEAVIYLYGYNKNGKQADFHWTMTKTNGHYEFDNLNPFLSYRMVCGKYGYELGKHDVYSFKPMGTGTKEYYEFDLAPLSGVYGTIVNEQGKGISVHIYLDGGYQFAFKPPINFSTFPFAYKPTAFHIDVPENKIHMIVDADDEAYADWDTTFTVQGKFIRLPKPIVIKKEMRKLKLTISSVVGKWGFLVRPLAKARVVVNGVSDTLTAGNDGVVKYRFNSSQGSDNFRVTVLSPKSMSYQMQQLNVKIPVSKGYNEYKVLLRNGVALQGTVLDNNGQPVSNALVLWKNGSSGSPVSAYTDVHGHYKLTGLPAGKKLQFAASKPGSQFIGQTKSLYFGSGAHKLDFTLRRYGKMDISHLLGFEMAVDSLAERNEKTYIWGYLCHLAPNPDFATTGAGQRIPFSHISIVPKKADGKTTAYPENGTFVADINRLNLKTLGFGSYAKDEKGLVVKQVSYSTSHSSSKYGQGLTTSTSGSYTGAVRGNLFLDPASIQAAKFMLKTAPGLYAESTSGTEIQNIYSLTARGITTLLHHKLNIHGSGTKPLAFKVYGFDATSAKTGSYLTKDTLVLNAHLHTQLTNSTPADLNIPLGKLKITQNNIVPVYGKTALGLKLQQWTIHTDKWKFDKTGFTMVRGKLDMNGAVISFTDMKVKPASLYRGTFDFSAVKLLGSKKLAFTPNVKTFLTNKEKYWRFEIFPADDQAYCASIGSLPALDPADKILIEKIVLFSTLNQGLPYYKLPEKHPWVNVYKTLRFKPSQLYVYSGKISLNGLFEPGIPNTDRQTYFSRINYTKGGNGNLVFAYEPFNFKVQARACLMEFDRQSEEGRQLLTAAGFTAKGTIAEKPYFKFLLELNKTAKEHVVTATLKPNGQKWNFSKGKTLHNLRGSMKAAPASWPVFSFTGDVEKDEFNGASGPMKFVVNGEITGDKEGSKISLNKVSTPFGDMNFTFDYSIPSIVGNLKFQKKIGSAEIKGGIQMVLDNKGWYFLGGGDMKFPNPYFEEGMAGIVFGNYPVNNDMKRGFLAYSGVQFPLILFPKQLNGFMFAGTVIMQPSPIPDVNIDVGIASVEFNVDVGASLGMGANFDKANFLALADLSLYAYFKVSAAGLVEGSIDGKLYTGAVGMLNLNSGAFIATGEAGLKMSGKIDVAGKTVLSGSFDYGVNIKITHKPDQVTFSIK